MADGITLTLAPELLNGLEEMVRRAVADEIAHHAEAFRDGFLNVNGAAEFLATTPDAVRALVKSERIPVHRTPAGRLLFDREELRAWVMAP